MHTEHKEIPSVSLDIRGMQTKAKKEMPLHIYWKSTVKKKRPSVGDAVRNVTLLPCWQERKMLLLL